jgi:hypothetical protein
VALTLQSAGPADEKLSPEKEKLFNEIIIDKELYSRRLLNGITVNGIILLIGSN